MGGDRFDEGIGEALYGLVGVALSPAWLWLYHHLRPANVTAALSS
ncbi:hypothetical protein [Micromonospora sediminicola]